MHLRRVGLDDGCGGVDRDADLELLLLDPFGQVGGHRSKERRDVDGVHVRRFLLSVETRQAQEVADQALHSSRVALDDFEELPPLLGRDGLVHQRFDVAAHGRQRRAQLVRDIRHEIAPHAIHTPQIADVVQHEHGAAEIGACRGGLRAKNAWPACGGSRIERYLNRRAVLAFERGAQLADDAGLAHGLDVVASDQVVFEIQHAPRRVVRKTQPSFAIDHEHPFHHAREDG